MPKHASPAPRGELNLERELNAEQRAVVEHGSGPALVLAGAGSGKTRTIVYRLAHLLARGEEPSSVLLLTFTNKAAREMLTRAEQLTGVPASQLWGGTFHHVANRLLRRYAPLVGRQPNFTILDQEDSHDLLKRLVKQLGLPYRDKLFPSPAVLGHLISLSTNTLSPLDEVIASRHPHLEKVRPQVERVAEAYRTQKRELNAVDFDDLLYLLAALLRERADVREQLQRRFRWLLVDEYQDTNKLQGLLVALLAGPTGNVVAVGDDAQSIYGFRGAHVDNILSFSQVFPGAKVFRLETNYRSTPQILNVANAVIARNVHQYAKTLRAISQQAGKPVVVSAGTPEDEARFVAEEVTRIHRDGTPLARLAVLFRATFHSQALEFELSRRGIPYDYRGGVRFFERAHIKDALAFLRVFANVKDEVAWIRLLTLQAGIGPANALKAAGAATAQPSLAEALSAATPVTGAAAGGWKSLSSILSRLATAADPTPSRLLEEVVHSSYRDYLEAQYENWEERLDDLSGLAQFAGRYADVTAFLAEASLHEGFAAVRNVGGQAEAPDRLVLSTIHQAKGLEWHAVFAINLLEGALPHRRSLANPDDVEEERRLFYVAVTRAERQLYLSYPIVGGSATQYVNERSRFLNELPWGVTDERQFGPAASGYEATVEVGEDGERRPSFPRSKTGGLLPDVEDL